MLLSGQGLKLQAKSRNYGMKGPRRASLANDSTPRLESACMGCKVHRAIATWGSCQQSTQEDLGVEF